MKRRDFSLMAPFTLYRIAIVSLHLEMNSVGKSDRLHQGLAKHDPSSNFLRPADYFSELA